MVLKNGQYVIEHEISHGAMGTVFQAVDTNLGRRVAIKMLRRAGNNEPERNQRFLAEAQRMAELDHPYIMPIRDFGYEGGQPFLVMPLLRTSLQDILGSGLSLSLILQYFEQLTAAVEYLHAGTLVHRDIKPTNILLDEDRRYVRLGDFGIAIFRDGRVTNARAGSAQYKSPEQWEGDERLLGPGTDIYQLGCVLFALLTGQPPYVGDRRALRQGHLSGRPPSLTRFLPDGYGALDSVLAKALQRGPQDRYGSAIAFCEAFRSVVMSMGLGAAAIAASAPATSADSPVTACDARFRLLERLSTSGFQTAWRALDTATNSVIFLRLAHAESPGVLPLIKEFRRSQDLQAQSDRPDTLLLATDFIRCADGRVALVAPWMQGRSLAAQTAQGRLSLSRARDIALATCRAAHFLHDNGLVHRMIHPGNVLFDESGNPRLADLRHVQDAYDLLRYDYDDAAPHPIKEGFSSPEAIRGEPLDEKHDVYSIGCLLWHMLTGRLYDAGDKRQICCHRADTPRKLALLIHSCLSNDSSARPTSGQLLSDLESVPARPVSLASRTTRRYVSSAGSITIQWCPIGCTERAFWMSHDVVTVGQYSVFAGSREYQDEEFWGRHLTDNVKERLWVRGEPPNLLYEWMVKGYGRQRNHPAANVTWYEALLFCRWLSELSGQVIDLPSDQEWKAAAQGPCRKRYPWGDSFNTTMVRPRRPRRSSSDLCPYDVSGNYAVSDYGCRNSCGLVWQWLNGLEKNFDLVGHVEDGKSPFHHRIARGGSWQSPPEHLNSLSRLPLSPFKRQWDVGFRCVNRSL